MLIICSLIVVYLFILSVHTVVLFQIITTKNDYCQSWNEEIRTLIVKAFKMTIIYNIIALLLGFVQFLFFRTKTSCYQVEFQFLTKTVADRVMTYNWERFPYHFTCYSFFQIEKTKRNCVPSSYEKKNV